MPEPLPFKSARGAPGAGDAAAFVRGDAGETAIYHVSPDVLACPLGEGLALFDARSNTYFSLNRSGAIIWRRAGEGVLAKDLRAAVAASFGMEEREVSADVDRVIAELVDADLLTVCLAPLLQARA